MKDLGPTARALLRAAQRYDTPGADVAARVWEHTQLRAAAGDLGPILPEDATATASAATTKLMTWLVAAALGGGALAAGWALSDAESGGAVEDHDAAPAVQPESEPALEPEPEPALPLDLPSRPEPQPSSAAVSELSSVSKADTESSAERGSEDVAEVAVRPRPARKRPRREIVESAPKPAPSEDVGSDFGAEVELMGRARAALGRGDAAKALSLFERHGRQFPRGALARERDVSRIMALCALGRTQEARARASRFLDRDPRSALADRVRRTCAGEAAK